MFRKIFILWVLLSLPSIAADKGIYVVFDINSQDGDEAAVGTANYYYQGGNLLAEMNLDQGSLENVTMLETDGVLYTLFPKEKKYMEIPQYMAEVAAELTKKESAKGSFKPTGKKKKIAGHDCEVYMKDTKDSLDTACLNQPLYKTYKDFFTKMQKLTKNHNLMMGTEGFPLEVTSTGKGKNKHNMTLLVKKINQQDYKNKFLIPKDYQKQNVLQGAAEMFQKIKESK
jgi:hypothetical protein